MSVIYVFLCFVFMCLILVHINLHQKKNELVNYIYASSKVLLTRHKKIHQILKFAEKTDLTIEIEKLNNEAIENIKQNVLRPSEEVRLEVLLEEKINELLSTFENKNISQELSEAIESYQITQKKVEKCKKKYNKMMTDFMDACSIKPADFFAMFEKIDTNFPKVI